ncbi:F-box only protein 40 [Xenopus laevis]|uniref:F-box only protein 40 n=1 Tax=Xenopus laevis TaxID=8355 RepID=A0A8J0UBZ6_XENLA|nr:F-box only protein 40 [Xenopus laevis]
MGRTHRPPAGHHQHCERCFSKRCQVPINTGFSCIMINCRSNCGATFHLCKEEEHQLLCPYEWVPCLNSGFGCPFSMSRFKLAKHLAVCPASVVCCSMDWNRWPVIDKVTPFYGNIMSEKHSEECLDVALAIRDQNILFDSLKMADIFPELSEQPNDTEAQRASIETEEDGAVGGAALDTSSGMDLSNGEMVELTQFEREALARGQVDLDVSKFSQWDSIFSKEKTTAKCLEAKMGKTEDMTAKVSEKTDDRPSDEEKNQKSEEARNNLITEGIEKTGLAPWQEGVLERLKQEVDCSSYNMYLVHHGKMLIHFGQMAACTPKEKDFVYGKLEPQTVKTVYTFKVPTSYCGRRAKLEDDRSKKEKAHKLVDTSDLGVQVDNLPLSEAINTTLLCALEKELKGHAISESKALDGLLIDFGTQTYDFGLDAFTKKTVLADLLMEKTMGIHLDLESECVTRRHNKNNSSFTFSCNLFFRRDEFPHHFRNAHSDIQSGLSGWFQQRCPLSYLGCTFVQNKLCPKGKQSHIIYSKQLKTFALKPEVPDTLYEGVRPNLSRSQRGRSKDSLSSLPLEVLQHIAAFLDSFSLCQFSQVSSLMRDVCATLLQERGMVHLYWEKKTYSHGGTSWRCRRKVWNFSSLFSRVQQWEFDDVPSMAEHLKVCPFNCPELKTNPFKLPSLYECQGAANESLLTFQKKL